MIQPFHHNNLLSEFVANSANEAWAKDLVCLSATKNGALENADYEYIFSELENKASAQTLTLPVNVNDKYPRVELFKLTHQSGINALANNQTIVFCNEGEREAIAGGVDACSCTDCAESRRMFTKN